MIQIWPCAVPLRTCGINPTWTLRASDKREGGEASVLLRLWKVEKYKVKRIYRRPVKGVVQLQIIQRGENESSPALFESFDVVVDVEGRF